MGAYLDQWLAHARSRVRAKTYDGYEALIRLYALPGMGPMALGELGPLALQSLYRELLARGLSATLNYFPPERPRAWLEEARAIFHGLRAQPSLERVDALPGARAGVGTSP